MNIQDVLEKYPRETSYLLEILHEVFKPESPLRPTEENIKAMAKHLKTTEGHIHGVMTFYSMFPQERKTPYVISICKSIVCYLNNSEHLIKTLKTILNVDKYNISRDGLFSIKEVECLGLCDVSPAIMVNDEVYERVTEEKIKEIILELRNEYNRGKET